MVHLDEQKREAIGKFVLICICFVFLFRDFSMERLFGFHGSEVLVFDEIKSPDCSIRRATQYRVAFLGHEFDVCNRALMVIESRKT